MRTRAIIMRTFRHYIALLLAMVLALSAIPCANAISPYTETEDRNVPPSADEMVVNSTVWMEGGIEEIDIIEINGEQVVASVPNYYQNYHSYKDLPYGKGTLGSSGCGIACMAMVATYVLDDPELTPDVLAMEFGHTPGSNGDRMERAANTLGIPFERSWDWETVVRSLEQGKIIIALVNSNSEFTTGGHFIVLTGIEDSRILVNDPNWYNYRRLSYGFENGFDQWDITCGFSGAWIFEKPEYEATEE